MNTPIFILFAELMGYKSALVEQAEKWCSGDLPSEEVQRVMGIDALNIKRVMDEDYTEDEIEEWFEVYWSTVLSEYGKTLTKLLEKRP